MNGPGREERTLARLVRVARARLAERGAHLESIKAAKAAAEAGLARLAAADPEAALFDPLLGGAAEKRRALEATRDQLAAEITRARKELDDAQDELAKLERLIEANRRLFARRRETARWGGFGDLRRRRG
ncbi:hypothetical protein [Amphiplicatus metriothermophilus]|uniref:Flagellar FliJ protein n=1 Tax=Amphiplicatus metriothermophilus TaxID=1519374 RepID=A0A239PTR4_9PROT|nr:hypothetical protein [Amphiplicatus metriothermophilus]MBB5519243.1 chromosome segregation ATPase [Amphiplicatus metriothermophilus]SNT73312.1 hypothetical protein SAMN06297382_1710 [Amphiplicatus metriothermophilus]